MERLPTLEQYRHFREVVGWGNGDPAAQTVGLANSLFAVCALYGEDVVGCARVVGDAGIYFYVQDVIVLPQYRRLGLGHRLMDAVMTYIHQAARPGAFIALMAARGATSFYLPYGFNERPPDGPGMWFMKGA